MTEKQIEAWLGKQVKALGCLYYKFVSPGNDGVPDRIIVLPGGKVFFIELKAEQGRLTPMQSHQIGQLRNQGCLSGVVYGLSDAAALVDLIRKSVEGKHGV